MNTKNVNRLTEVMSYNKDFVDNKDYEKYTTDKNPKKKMVILTCMDTRLIELLPQAMNIKNGDAKIVKNAGATIIHPFGSIMRSILVSVYEFNTKDVFVVGHHGCGMSNLDSNQMIDKMLKRDIKPETFDTLNHSGINVSDWLHGFESVESAIKESVFSIKNHPLLPNDVSVHGLIMDPYTGALEIIVDGCLK